MANEDNPNADDRKDCKLKLFIKRNKIVLIGIVIAILALFVVHFVYSTPAISEWWSVKAGAGDVLVYIGTVSVAILAIWQNLQLQRENEKAQANIIQISRTANRLIAIERRLNQKQSCINETKEYTRQICNLADPRQIEYSFKPAQPKSQTAKTSTEMLCFFPEDEPRTEEKIGAEAMENALRNLMLSLDCYPGQNQKEIRELKLAAEKISSSMIIHCNQKTWFLRNKQEVEEYNKDLENFKKLSDEYIRLRQNEINAENKKLINAM